MPKGRASKLIHNNNGILNKTEIKQQTCKIYLQYEDNISNYHEAFDRYMKVICFPHKIKGHYIININGLNDNELKRLQNIIQDNANY